MSNVENAEQDDLHFKLLTLYDCIDKIMPLMKTPDIYEIYANADGRIWTLSNAVGKKRTDIVMEPIEVRNIIQSVAALDDRIIDDVDPKLDAKIPGNPEFPMCRFHGTLPPTVLNPVMNIRKHSTVIFTLEDYLNQGTITKQQYDILVEAIRKKKNIIAAGGTGSGKTTLLNAILQEISKSPDRIISIEDTNELQCSAEDYVAMTAEEGVTMHSCVKQVLRMTPKRIVVGEVRGEEALDLLTAWSTGHKGGCCTVHSNDAVNTLTRLVDMTSRVTINPQPRTIAEAIDIILYIRFDDNHNKRWIEDIISIDGYEAKEDKFLYHKLCDTVRLPG